MNGYPGNPQLPAEVKERVLSTFRHTLDLYRQGNTNDTITGCDFILKMDSLFEPAKKLLVKANNPFADIDVDDLLPAGAPGGSADLDDARMALVERDFQRAIDLCNAILGADLTNVEAQEIGNEAQEKLEAAPFVEQFLDKGTAALAAGNVTGARSFLEKARALDASHPGIGTLEARLSSGAGAGPGTTAPASSSFVVDSPRPSAPPPPAASQGRSSADSGVSDFGFTFEEEPGGSPFSFNEAAPVTPTAPASTGFGFPGEGQTFDFATASVETSAEDEAKVRQYLEEGDRAFAAGDYQKATETWSKIFLIDVTNEEASERVEKARRKRLEVDRQIEDLMIEATAAYDEKNFMMARAKFENVLKLDPRNANAADYLSRLGDDTGAFAAPARASKPSVTDELYDDFEGQEPRAEILRIPDPGERPSRERAATPPPSTGKKLPLGAIGAVLALLVLGGGGWFAWTHFFANRQTYNQAETQAAFTKAQALARKGRYDEAIALLVGIKPDDPEHDHALEMIADLKKKKSETAGMIDGRPAEVVFNEYIAGARVAVEAHDYLAAKTALEKASAIRALPADAKALYDDASQQVAKLDTALGLFKSGDYNGTIQAIEPMLKDDPTNKNMQQLVMDSHFNLGVTALREEKLADAITEFDVVLKSNPDDELARRSREIAVRYDDQPKDLLYKIYVKYLPLRELREAKAK